MRIAFYATMKPPDHNVPSGDREMARVLMQACSRFADVQLASRIVQRSRVPDPAALLDVRSRALLEAERLRTAFAKPEEGWRPDVWMTYHLYYKGPDWLGSTVADALGIPYIVVEASYAGKRDRDAWAPWQAAAVQQLRQAAAVLSVSEQDSRGLAKIVAPDRIHFLPPFIDTEPFVSQAPTAAPQPNEPVRLVTVAMMRSGAKVESYRALARALCYVTKPNWTLEIIGDGPAQDDVRAAFADLPADKIIWRGQLEATSVRDRLVQSDVLIWPGIAEGFGMVYLEAQAAGLPVAAFETAGVPSVVQDGETGLLTADGDVAALAASINQLISDVDLRARLSANARRFVLEQRGIAAASDRIHTVIGAASSRE